jgi:uncharacterized RDD family membrane protein YckC
MKCNKCGLDVPSNYLKCPSCSFAFPKAGSNPNGIQIGQQTNHHPQTQASQSSLPAGVQLASISSRFSAMLIDGLLLIVPAGILGAVVGIWGSFFDDSENLTALKAQMVGYLIWILYGAVFLSGTWKATPGKKLLAIHVVDLNGNRISFWRAVGRSAGQFLSAIFFIGYIMAFFTKDKQALHDLMAGTLVIKD